MKQKKYQTMLSSKRRIIYCHNISVTPQQSTITFSYILRELSSGMNYTITMRAGNILGESSPVIILVETIPTGK